jgi:hypothetical protein
VWLVDFYFYYFPQQNSRNDQRTRYSLCVACKSVRPDIWVFNTGTSRIKFLKV